MNLKFSSTSLGRFRLIALAEGISFLLLLVIAMPMKYFMDMPEVVKYTGWAHGLLFVLFQIGLINVMVDLKWSIKKAVICFIASFVPFGTFIIDRNLRKEEAAILEEKKTVDLQNY